MSPEPINSDIIPAVFYGLLCAGALVAGGIYLAGRKIAKAIGDFVSFIERRSLR